MTPRERRARERAEDLADLMVVLLPLVQVDPDEPDQVRALGRARRLLSEIDGQLSMSL